MQEEEKEKGETKEYILENLNNLEKKQKIRKLLVFAIIFVIIIIIGFLSLSFYAYYQSPEKTLGLGANIESALLSAEGKIVYLKLDGGSLDKNITKIKFTFIDSEENEFIYETSEGTQDIEVPFKKGFWDWLLGRQFVGSYDYEINSESVGIDNFENIKNIDVLFEYKTETGESVDSPVLDTQRTTNATNTTTTSSGSSRTSSGNDDEDDEGDENPPPPTCTPDCSGKICEDDGCGGSCGSCNSGYFCNASWVCEEIIIQTTNNISQFNITWHFDKEYEYGQFANKDYWIVPEAGESVTIIRIEPASTDIAGRVMNGAMLNPNGANDGSEDETNTQGFDSLAGGFNSSLNVARPNGDNLNESNPLVIQANKSLVSSKSFVDNKGGNAQLEDFAVLSILSEAPPVNSFRPAYASIDKTIKYTLSDINLDVLKDLTIVGSSAPDLSTLVEWFKYPCIAIAHDGAATVIGGNRCPQHDDYTQRIGQAALLLNCNFTDAEKQAPLIHILQNGIDRYGVLTNGGRKIWRGNGAWNMGVKLTIMFTANVLSNNDVLLDVGSKSGDYWESGGYGRQTWPDIMLPPDLYYFSEDTDTLRISSWDILTSPYPFMVTGGRTTTVGNVKVTNGSKTVIGVGTSFLDGKHDKFGQVYNENCGNFTYGAWFAIPTDNQAYDVAGKAYDLADFVSDTEITLKEPYTGNTDQTGTLTYAISSVIYYGHGADGASNPPNCYRGRDFNEVTDLYLNWPEWVNYYIGGKASVVSPDLFSRNYRGNCGRNYGSQALPAMIMGLKDDWNHDVFFDYTDRYIEWARDEGISDFQDQFSEDMWNAYRSQFGCVWEADTGDENAGGGFHYDCSGCLYNCLTSLYCGDENCNGDETSESCAYDCVEVGSLSPFTKLLNFIKSLLTTKTGNAILAGKTISGNAVNETNENGKFNFKIQYIILSLFVVVILIIAVVIVKVVKIKKNKKDKKKFGKKSKKKIGKRIGRRQ